MTTEVGSIKRVTDNQEIIFRCNICDKINEARLELLSRDEPSCKGCGSSVRLRSIIQILTTEIFGQSICISQIRPSHPQLTGIGLSCWEGYAIPLARRLGFKNTFYHKEPRLDITDLGDSAQGSLDFIIASDVYEHIEPPVERAFNNARNLLKDDGLFIFSVPFIGSGLDDIPIVEHFPDLHNYNILKKNNSFVLKNVTKDGRIQYFENLVFHGGPGSTLEMRLFSESSIISLLANAGFSDISIYSGSDIAHGIYWPHKWSVPIAARIRSKGKPNYAFDEEFFRREKLCSLLRRKVKIFSTRIRVR